MSDVLEAAIPLKEEIAQLKSKLAAQAVKIEKQRQEVSKLNEALEKAQQVHTDLYTTHTYELKKFFHLLTNLFQQSSESIAALNKDLRVELLNRAFSDLFLKIFSIEIRVGMCLSDVLTEFPDLKAKINHATQQALLGKRMTLVLENSQSADTDYYYYEFLIDSLYNEDMNKRQIILRIRNHTKRKLRDRRLHNHQSELALSCRTMAMGEMASALAHEINQPLTTIVAYSRSCLFMINQSTYIEKIPRDLLIPLEKIAHQAELAGSIVHNMKNFINKGTVQFEQADINLIIKETLSILSYELRDFKLKITLNLRHPLPLLQVNRIHIMQVILNLARNSIEALQNSGHSHPELRISTQKLEQDIVVHLSDNGPGIPAELQDKILHTYFTTKKQGTGIGLGICRSLIEAHGGKLCVHQPVQGAWFSFSLPINKSDLDEK